jgi:ABC-type multidrug transport system fused ATPase/permease subunit
MVTEILLSTLLTTSIAGAGLLIAIYTLIAQLRNRLFEKRLALYHDKMSEFDKTKQNITPEESQKGTEQLREIGYEIKSMKSFPSYLSSVKWVFTGYIISALFCLLWLIDRVQNPLTAVEDVVQNPQAELFLILIFFLTTVGFFGVVWSAVKDVHELMKADFEALKKEQEEMEKKRKEIEDYKRKIREAKSE